MKNSLTKSAIWIFIINIVSKLLGLVRESTLAYKFGTSAIVDTYTVAITFPSIIFAVFCSGVSGSYIPVASRVSSEKARKTFTNNTITVMLIISFVIVAVCILLSEQIAGLLAPGFNNAEKMLLEHFLRIISCVLPIMVFYNIVIAYMEQHEIFIVPYFSNFIIVNLLIIGSICLSSERKPEILIIGYIVGYIIPLLIVWCYADKKTGFLYVPTVNLKDENLKQLLRFAVPMGASVLISQINSMIDRMFASFVGEGVIAALGYADKVQQIFYTLIVSIIITICYPRISKHMASQNFEQGMSYVKRSCMISTLFGLPVTMFIMLFSKQIVQIVFQRGSFDVSSTAVTANCLIFYSIGILFYAYREIFTRALYTIGKQKKVLKNTIITVISNVILDLVLIKPLGYVGLPLATSIAGVIASVLMYADIKKAGLKLLSKNDKKEILKIGLASLLSMGSGIALYKFCNFICPELSAFIISAVVVAAVYAICIIALKTETFSWLLYKVKETLKR